jgi:hypothetical protein
MTGIATLCTYLSASARYLGTTSSYYPFLVVGKESGDKICARLYGLRSYKKLIDEAVSHDNSRQQC